MTKAKPKAVHSIRALAAAVMLAAGLMCVAEPLAAGSGLEAARNELRLRARAEQRMREDFESLLANGRMSAQEISDFEVYLAQLATLVEEQRRVVAELEAGGSAAAPGAAQTPALPGDFDRGQTDEEKIALLDAQLGSSLSEFDEKLLREQKEIAEKSRSSGDGDDDSQNGDGASGQAGQAGQADGSADQGGEGDAGAGQAESRGESSTGTSAEGGETSDRAGGEEQGRARGESGEGVDQVASAGGENSASGESGRISTPPDIPDGKDDDIVARQLREAAENEQDPELREKLWEEYRRYKKGTR